MPEPDKPRRRNAAETKSKILAAAQKAFSETGYTPTGIRHIATLAGVDSALVQRYFGSKSGLFEAALTDIIPSFESFDIPPADFGSLLTAETLANFFDMRAQSMIVLSVNDPEARIISAAVLKKCALTPLAELLGGPNATARAFRLVMLSTAFMLYTRQVQLMTPEAAVETKTSEWLSGLLQDIVAEPKPPPVRKP
jgi:AcrR family transcriptional regulator